MLKRIVGAMAVATVVWVAACGDDATGPPEGVQESELEFLKFPPDLAPLATRDTSFWAVAGEDRELLIRYRPLPDESEGETFLEFRVSGNSLLTRADGSPFVRGDSVEIHVRVDPDGRFLFDFEPSGLKFDPDHPAELDITYMRLGGDLDGDGDVDEDDEDFEQQLQLWKQETPGGLWIPVGSVQIEDQDEIEAEVVGFTGFALAV